MFNPASKTILKIIKLCVMSLNKIIFAMYLLHFTLYSYLNVLYVAGFPLRSLVIVLTGIMVVVSNYKLMGSLGIVNIIYAILATLGLIISLINDRTLSIVIDGELKLVQSYLVILVSYYILVEFGFKVLGISIIILTLPTAIVGILQGLNIDIAWEIHDMLNHFMGVTMDAEFLEAQKGRAPGLANFAIPQSSLLLSIIFLTCYFILAVKGNPKLQYLLFILNLIFVLAILASQTRSALGAAFITIIIVYLKSLKFEKIIPFGLFFLLAFIFFTLVIGDTTDTVDSRLASLGDQSAMDKLTLSKYSIDLFLHQPYGYGFNFDTVKYATPFFLNNNTLFDYDVLEKAQYLVPVHNAMAHIAITYGFIGLILLFIYIYQLSKFRWYHILFVSSVLLNSSFHNVGILNGDLNIDMIFAIFLYEKDLIKQANNLKYG